MTSGGTAAGLFQRRLLATGNARSPTVDIRVGYMESLDSLAARMTTVPVGIGDALDVVGRYRGAR